MVTGRYVLLKENKFKADDIVSLKLSTGEEIIGKLTTNQAVGLVGTMEIKQPLTVMMAPNGGIALMSFMVSLPDDGIVEINTKDIISIIKTRKELADGYIRQVTNVELPTPSDTQSLSGSNQVLSRGSRGGLRS